MDILMGNKNILFKKQKQNWKMIMLLNEIMHSLLCWVLERLHLTVYLTGNYREDKWFIETAMLFNCSILNSLA